MDINYCYYILESAEKNLIHSQLCTILLCAISHIWDLTSRREIAAGNRIAYLHEHKPALTECYYFPGMCFLWNIVVL
jgi:hypothetical protein